MVFGDRCVTFSPLSLKSTSRPRSVTQEYREWTMAKKRESDVKKWREKTRDLEDLEIGTPSPIQNQTGKNPNKWDKTGISGWVQESHHEEQEVHEAPRPNTDENREPEDSEEGASQETSTSTEGTSLRGFDSPT